ncbi:MAG: DUF4037 domain-containing protein [Desulfovibrionaceae bacterium]
MTLHGLPLAKEFYQHCAQPLFAEYAPDLFAVAAFGLVGEGSECYGFDDTVSRDHDWGPAFCVWLPSALLADHLAQLENVLCKLPATFQGWPTRMRPEQRMGRVGPQSIEDFYARFTRLPRLPEHWREWRLIPEHFLAVATNGEVFHDTLGLFSTLRQGLLHFYPEDLRRKKIAARCMGMAQAGQYNVLRSLKRCEAVPALLSAARFAEQALSMVYLLNKKYMPFYKWAHRGVIDLPVLGALCHETLQQLSALTWAHDVYTHADHAIEILCAAVAGELRVQGLSDASGDWLLDHGPRVQQTIENPELRNIPVMLE